MERKISIKVAAAFMLLLTLSLIGCHAEVGPKTTRTITFTDIPEDITLIMVSVDRTGGGSIAGAAATKDGKLPNGDSWTEIKNGRTVVKLYKHNELLSYILAARSGVSISKPATEQMVDGSCIVTVQPYKGTNPESPVVWGSESAPLQFNKDNQHLRWRDGK